MPNVFTNQARLTNRRKHLRKHATIAERILWKHVRSKQLGVKFRRQYSIGGYIVDFFCYELKLIVELDGGIHGTEENILKDRKRESWLRAQGYTILRYTNEQVINTTEHVCTDLKQHIARYSPPRRGS